ncbi:aspartyl protease family protein [Caulobacter sp. NIBR1757]|uniref:aspartyl protease family protein n=1 Tax=Caulobacter sp. NIBR1757 TaxID=3016000 RepID=UPI0022F0A985|nr:aspartyl protease family protein [Caulobacter sp. NIBR1757]WGM39479.1 hypothetical protein AMEJIAPC_02401 [Caulobacter sp. NIBR1757]
MLTRRLLIALGASLPIVGAARAQTGAIVAKVRLENGRVVIDTHLNGKGPYAFVIDTGAVVSGVEDDLARSLGLKLIRQVRLNNGRTFPLYGVDELVLGGAVRQQDASLFGLKADLRGGDGLIAAGLMTTHDSILDFDREEWRLYPGGLGARPGYSELDSEIQLDPGSNGSRRISVQAVLDGKRLKLLIDTGAPRMVVLDPDIGKGLGYWDDTKVFAPAAFSGITGTLDKSGRTVRGKLLEIGPGRFERPLVTTRYPGAPVIRGFDGIIGLPVLERLNLSVAAAARRLWVQPNGRPQRREAVNRSGLWLDPAKGGARVAVVATGSPAAAAGLKVGDRIAGPAEFGEVLRLLGGAAGETVTLRLEGPAGARDVSFVLADYV